MADAKRPRIKVTRNGPYLVSGGVPLTQQIVVSGAAGIPESWRTGQEYPTQENYALCRCGRSENQPFCDGEHMRGAFDGRETASRRPYLERAETVKGPALTLKDDKELCVGAGFCDRAGGIRYLISRSDNPEAKKIAIEECRNCPSGRLVVWDEVGKPLEPGYEPSAGIMEDPQASISGPITVRGSIPIESAEGTEYERRNRVTLCRCSRSANKPFCDGSHMD